MKKFGYFVFGVLCAVGLSLVVAQNSPTPIGIGQGADNDSSSVTTKDSGDVLTAGEFNRIFRILKGIILSPASDGTPRYVIGSDGTGTNIKGVDNDLTVDIEGKIGANEYCDGMGQNCKNINQIGGGNGLFVGLTPNPYTGNAVGGYDGANAKCAAVSGAERICTMDDIAHTLAQSGAASGTPEKAAYDAFATVTGQVWFNQSTGPGYFWAVNDCVSWSAQSVGGKDAYGAVWAATQGTSAIQKCSESLALACCTN